jgi:hypothetical protein
MVLTGIGFGLRISDSDLKGYWIWILGTVRCFSGIGFGRRCISKNLFACFSFVVAIALMTTQRWPCLGP